MLFRLLLLSLLFSLSACEKGNNSTLYSQRLIDSILIYEDVDSKYDFLELQKSYSILKFKKQNQSDKIDLTNNNVHWISIIPAQEINIEKDYILELNRPTLDHLSAFIVKQDGSWEAVVTGDATPFKTRHLRHENFLFKISGAVLKAINTPLFLKVQSDSVTSSSIKLLEENSFYEADQKRSLASGVYFGVLLALVLFNFLIFLSVRDVSYLWYVGYLGFILVFLLAYDGLTYRYLWPNNPWWANCLTHFFLMMAMSMGLGFTRSITHTTSFYPVLASVMKWSAIVIAILAFLGLMLGNLFISTTALYSAPFVLLLIIVAIIMSIKKGYKPAYYVGIAFLFLLLGSLMMILYKFQVLPSNVFSEYGFQMGIMLEAFLLSFTLSYRIKYINDELRESNKKVIDSKKFFSSRLIEFQDKQLKETSETLHDSIGQKLLVVKIQLAQIFEIFNVQEDHNKVKSIMGLMHEIINDVRDISHSLHPHQIERLTLEEALEDVVFQSFRDTSIKATYHFNGLENIVDTRIKLHLYRIIQETITNIVKHSGASFIDFSSNRIDKNLVITIKDDGKGISNESWFKYDDFTKAYGLSNIKERVKSLKGVINFSLNNGTGLKIAISIPYKNGVDSNG